MKLNGKIFDMKSTENSGNAEMIYLAESSVDCKSVFLSSFNCHLLNSVISNSTLNEQYD